MILRPPKQAHALTPLIPTLYRTQSVVTSAADVELPPMPPRFPFLSLLISGGHTMLILASSPDEFKTLASSSDIAIGSAFDHVARTLGLAPSERGYGAALEAFCDSGHARFTDAVDEDVQESEYEAIPPIAIPMPRQLMFSYVGVRSRVEDFVRSKGGVQRVSLATRLKLARHFQEMSVKQLEEKTLIVLNGFKKRGIEVRDIVVSGGVASNSYLRTRCATMSCDPKALPHAL